MWQTFTKTTRILAAACLLAGFAGCEQTTDKTETGGVHLAITEVDGFPVVISVGNSGDVVQIDSLTVSSIVKTFDSPTSTLMDVELTTFEVIYTRADRGTREPPPLVQRIFGYVPVGGTDTILNLPLFLSAQLRNLPLSDLDIRGIDTETGSATIVLNVTMRFYGRTLSGDVVASNPRSFTLQVVP